MQTQRARIPTYVIIYPRLMPVVKPVQLVDPQIWILISGHPLGKNMELKLVRIYNLKDVSKSGVENSLLFINNDKKY